MVGAQIRLLSPSLNSVDISADLLEGHLQPHTYTHTHTGMVSHGSTVNSLAQTDVKVTQQLTGSRWESSHRLPLLSLEEATLM